MTDGSTATRSPPVRDLATHQPKPRRSASEIGASIEAGFQRAATEEILASHRQGLPVAVSAPKEVPGASGAVAWLHPDGVVRRDRKPIHLPAEPQP